MALGALHASYGARGADTLSRSLTHTRAHSLTRSPSQALKMDCFRPSSHTTVCGWKGTASYYDIVVNGETNANAAWYVAPRELQWPHCHRHALPHCKTTLLLNRTTARPCTTTSWSAEGCTQRAPPDATLARSCGFSGGIHLAYLLTVQPLSTLLLTVSAQVLRHPEGRGEANCGSSRVLEGGRCARII